MKNISSGPGLCSTPLASRRFATQPETFGWMITRITASPTSTGTIVSNASFGRLSSRIVPPIAPRKDATEKRTTCGQ